MVFALVSRLARLRVTLSYAVILTGVSVTLSKLDPALQNRVIDYASTNLHNLSRGHVETLVVSAFVADAGPEYEWVPGLVFLLAICELLWGSGRFLVTLALPHVGATLLVAGWLIVAVELGWLPLDVTSEADVGMSYCAVGVLGALAPAIPRPWRFPWIGWWLGVAIAVVVVEDDFAYLGHLVALLLGMVVATRFGTPQRWTPLKLVLLLLGATFGYLVLTNQVPQVVAAVGGLAGALLGAVIALVDTIRRSHGVDSGHPQTQTGSDAPTNVTSAGS
jgi:hypothetical protein